MCFGVWKRNEYLSHRVSFVDATYSRPQRFENQCSPTISAFPTICPFDQSLIDLGFGGPRRRLLGSLTRLVFYMASASYPTTGIEMTYSDGRSALLGSNSDCGISFFVSGPEGERINQISVLKDNQSITNQMARVACTVLSKHV
jgi:hypothetical protein